MLGVRSAVRIHNWIMDNLLAFPNKTNRAQELEAIIKSIHFQIPGSTNVLVMGFDEQGCLFFRKHQLTIQELNAALQTLVSMKRELEKQNGPVP